VRRQGRRVGPLARVDERDRRAFARRWLTTSSAYLVSAARAPCNDLHDITSWITTRLRVGVTDHVTDHYPNASGSRPSNVRDVGALGCSIENMPTSRRDRFQLNRSFTPELRAGAHGAPRTRALRGRVAL
jgi:hypothetical protein